MKKCIYVGAVVIAASGNIINAGSICTSTDSNESIALTNLKFKSDNKDMENKDEAVKADFDNITKQTGENFKFKKEDISKNIVFFGQGDAKMYLCVFNDSVYKDQSESTQNSFIEKLGDTNYYYAILDITGIGGSVLCPKGSLKIVAEDGGKGQFKIEKGSRPPMPVTSSGKPCDVDSNPTTTSGDIAGSRTSIPSRSGMFGPGFPPSSVGSSIDGGLNERPGVDSSPLDESSVPRTDCAPTSCFGSTDANTDPVGSTTKC